jgi:heavy metal sensor kinase
VVLRLRADLTDQLDSSLRPAAAQIASDYRKEGVPELADSAATVLSGERAAAQVLDARGRVLTAYGDPVAHTPMRAFADARRGGIATVALGGKPQDFRVAAGAVERDGERQAVVVAESLAPVQRSVRRVLVLLLLAGPAALLATAAGGWWLARRALRPIERITTAAERIGVGRLDERVDVPRATDEVGHLARTLNTMLDRIQRGVDEQHRLIADTSHELRTPLAAMRAELDVSLRADSLTPAARDVLESTREEVDRMSRTVDDLLTLAIADDGRLDLASDPVELGEIAGRVMAGLAPLAARRSVDVTLGGDAAPAVGDSERLGHAVRNVIENAIEFSPPGAVVEVTAWCARGESGLTITDAGPGIAPELRARVFDRFFRVDASRTRATGGSGLGLAIAREIVEAHGGRAWIDGREPHGVAVTIMLVAADRVGPDSTPAPALGFHEAWNRSS